MIDFLRQSWTGLRALIVLTALLGIGYPVLVWGIGRAALPDQSGGSHVTVQGRLVGSTLIGERSDGPTWFHGRPSAGADDAMASGGSNLGPSSPKLLGQIAARRAAVARAEGVPASAVPADAVTASGSGLDPDISPAYADLQVPRVARERRLAVDRVRALVATHTQGRTLGFLGQPRVDVLELNLALAKL